MKPAFFATLLTALLCCGLSVWARSDQGRSSLEVFERWSVDARFRVRGPRPVHPDVVLVTFDDRTAATAGPLFERRAGWARVIDAISAAGPRAIGVDAVFDAPERLLGEVLQDEVTRWAAVPPGEGDDAGARLLRRIADELAGDATLADSLTRAGNVVLIVSESQTDDAPAVSGLGKGRYGQATPTPMTPRSRGVVASRPELVRAARALGTAVVHEDETRTVRFVSLGRVTAQGVSLPLSVAVAATAEGVARGDVAFLGPADEVRWGPHVVPMDRGGVWLDFAGPAGTYPTWSAVDVVGGQVPVAALANKVVLLGVTRFGYDVARTPFGDVPGVEVQATAVDAVLSGRPLRRSPLQTDLAVVFTLGVVVALLFISRRVRPVLQVAGSVAVLVGWLGVAQLGFTSSGWWLPVALPSATVLACLLVGLSVSYATEAGQRQQLKKAFDHYVGKDVLRELMAHPEKLALGGEKRELTVLFSDIRDFTTLSERLSPVELVTFLNTYLSPMTRAVLAQGGLLDKYIGDAVMGVFGAPVPTADHAERALRTVARMHAALKDLNEGPLRALGLGTIAIGVGVNTGQMVVGNMGSAERFDYTVAGDSVNLASRLEGLSKVYGVFCLVGHGARVKVGPGFVFRELDRVQVKGKQEAVPVYELLEVEGSVLSERHALDAWAAGLTAFREGALPSAREHFARFATANPGDVAVARYLARLAELPEEAPPGFQAVSAFTSK